MQNRHTTFEQTEAYFSKLLSKDLKPPNKMNEEKFLELLDDDFNKLSMSDKSIFLFQLQHSDYIKEVEIDNTKNVFKVKLEKDSDFIVIPF